MKKTKIVSVLFGGALACALVFGATVAFGQGGSTEVPGAAVDDSGISGFFVGLAVKYPWVATVLLIIGGLRCLFKPVMVLLDGYVKANCSAAEYAKLQAFEAGPIYRWLSFGLDFVGSVKLPVVQNAEKLKS